MGQDRRLGVNRRTGGNRRIGADFKGYNGSERRSLNDRRIYIERRREQYRHSAATPFKLAS